MRPDDLDEFAGGDDFGSLPESGKMPLIAGEKIIRPRRIGALDEFVVVRVDCHSSLDALGLAGLRDDLVDFGGGELVGAVAAGFLSEQSEHFRLRRRQPHVVPDAEQNGLGRAAFFDDERTALLFHAAKQPAEVGSGRERRNHVCHCIIFA